MDTPFSYVDLFNESQAYVDIVNTSVVDTGTLNVSNNANFSYLGPFKLLETDGSENIIGQSLTNGQLLIGSTALGPVASTLTGTTNQINVTNGAGSIVLSTPQDINTTSTPTFNKVIFTGLLSDSVLYLNASGLIQGAQLSTGFFLGGVSGNFPVATNITSSDSSLTVTNSTGNIDIKINGSGTDTFTEIKTTNPTTNLGADHWQMQNGTSGTPKRWTWDLVTTESGANAGSDLYLRSYADDGSTKIKDAIIFTRSNGNIFVPASFIMPLTASLGWGFGPNHQYNIITAGDPGNHTVNITLPIADSSLSYADTFAYLLTAQTLGSKTILSNGSWADSTDNTKKLTYSLGTATTGTTTNMVFSQTANRTLTVPDATDTLALVNLTQTLDKKTLTNSGGVTCTSGNLHVQTTLNSIAACNQLLLEDSSVSGQWLRMGTVNGTGVSIIQSELSGFFSLPLLLQPNLGNVSINKTTNTYALDVAGTISTDTALLTPSITINSGTALTAYVETSTSTTWSGNWAAGSNPTVAINITKVGRQITLMINTIQATGNSSSANITNNTAIPAGYRPNFNFNFQFIYLNGATSTYLTGYATINTLGTITMQTNTFAAFPATTNTTGPLPFTVTYNI